VLKAGRDTMGAKAPVKGRARRAAAASFMVQGKQERVLCLCGEVRHFFFAINFNFRELLHTDQENPT
jgi:hypothetical protein